MSTRGQIQTEGSKVLLYMHGDAMPESVLPALLPFLVEFHAERGHDPMYLPARFLQRLANENDKALRDMSVRMSSSYKPNLFLSLGVGTEIHGDLDFFYRVRENGTVEVKVPTNREGRPKFKKVAEHPLGAAYQQAA